MTVASGVPDASIVAVDGPWQHRDVAANGARFHVAVAGEGPLVVLLHGFPQFWWAWRHQVPALADAGFRAAAMDLRGYGGSDKPPRGYDPFTLTADVAGVVRSLGARSATVVGHGFGGMLAWSMPALQPDVTRAIAVLSQAHPLRSRQAHLTDPRQLSAARHLLAFQPPVLPERALTRDGGALVERLLRDWYGVGAPDPGTLRRYREAIQIPGVAHCALESHRWAVRSVPRTDGRRWAARLREPVPVPVLHLHGGRDPVVLSSTVQGSGEYTAAEYATGWLPDAGHLPHEEDPAGVTDHLLRWLRGLRQV